MTDTPNAKLILSIEHDQRIDLTADGTAVRGYETYIREYVGMLESGLMARISNAGYKTLHALALRARILGDPRRPGAEEEFKELEQFSVVTLHDRGLLFCFPSREQLMKDTGIGSVHTIDAAMLELSEIKIVKRVSSAQPRLARGWFGPNIYLIHPESFIAKFESEKAREAESALRDRKQKLLPADGTESSLRNTVDRALKIDNNKPSQEEQIRVISKHFATCVGATGYEPSEKEAGRLAALLSEGFSVEEICAGISHSIERGKTAGRTVRSIAYCIPGIRENASQTPQGKAGMRSPKPSAVTGQPQTVIQVNPDLEKLAGGDAELRDLLEVVQERNPVRPLRKSDVRAWKAVSDRYRDLATVRATTPMGLVMQAVLKGIGANSDREGFFAPSLAEAILENWQREQGDQQPAERYNTSSREPNDHGRAVHRPTGVIPAIQTSDGSLDPIEVWDAALKELQRQMTKVTFDTWVRSTFVAEAWGRDGQGHAESSAPSAGQVLGEPTIVIGTRNPYAVEWLEHRLHTTIQRTVTGIVGQSVTVKYVCVNEDK